MKQIGTGLFLIVFVKHIIFQLILFGFIWGINAIFGTSINYWIPAAILFVITLLIVVAQLLMFKGARNQAKQFEKDFFKDF